MTSQLKVFDHYPEDFEKYDLCLEFRVEPQTNKIDSVGTEVLERLIGVFGAKYIYLFYSGDTSIVYALIRTALKLVKQKAEAEGYKLLLDGDRAKERAFDGDEEALVDPFSIPHIDEISRIEPFEFIYGEYVARADVQDLYYCPEGMTHPFHKVLRLKLLSRMLKTTEHIAKEGEISLDILLESGVIRDFHPVHDQERLDELREDWLATCSVPWRQPFPEIRTYFGEKMAYFFLFLGIHFFSMLNSLMCGISFLFLVTKTLCRQVSWVIGSCTQCWWALHSKSWLSTGTTLTALSYLRSLSSSRFGPSLQCGTGSACRRLPL